MALSKPNLKTLKNSTLEPSIDKSILNVNIDGVLQNKAGAVYVEDPNGYLQKIYITDNFGNYQQLIRTTTKQDIYLGQEFKKNEGYTEVIGSELVTDGNFPLPNTAWSTVGGTEITTDGARINNTITGTNSYILQLLPGTLSGKQFELTYDVIKTNGKTLALEQASIYSLNTSTIGTNRKLSFTWNRVNNGFVIKRLASGTDVTIDNVSVKEDTLYV
tara:strand:- start:130 stop:780 length:651 start_codon:yes stop_codon:yes gene_type:complete